MDAPALSPLVTYIVFATLAVLMSVLLLLLAELAARAHCALFA
jgi:hypothetical protein